MRDMKNRRKNYLVNKKIQMQFALLLVIQVIIPTSILGSFLYIVNRLYLSYLQRLVGESAISNAYVASVLNFSLLAVGVFLITCSLLLVFLGIRFSHNIAGPLYKLRRGMEDLANGNKVERMRFRKTDLVEDLSDTFNKIAEKLNLMK